MKFIGLLSGGKDSVYNIMECIKNGHELVAVAHMQPPPQVNELDSFMYQTVGSEAVRGVAECLGVPIFIRTIEGSQKREDLDYVKTDGDEVESLYLLLQEAIEALRREHVTVEAVSSGAILSMYQKNRVDNVCERLGLTSLAYMWRRDQTELLAEMIENGLTAMIIKVACIGLDGRHVGKTLAQIQPHLLRIKEEYGVNVCGEGGEYETFVVDAPIFKKRIVIDESEFVEHSKDYFSPVIYMRILKYHTEDKDTDN